jgi:hypothetical protein
MRWGRGHNSSYNRGVTVKRGIRSRLDVTLLDIFIALILPGQLSKYCRTLVRWLPALFQMIPDDSR